MSITYDNILYDEILNPLLLIIAAEFPNVYIGKYKSIKGESLRMFPVRSEQIQGGARSEVRDYYFNIRIYVDAEDTNGKFMAKEVDRLNKLLKDNIINGTNWADLTVDINYEIEEEEPNVAITEFGVIARNYYIF